MGGRVRSRQGQRGDLVQHLLHLAQRRRPAQRHTSSLGQCQPGDRQGHGSGCHLRHPHPPTTSQPCLLEQLQLPQPPLLLPVGPSPSKWTRLWRPPLLP
jgi:hypothetical protein